MTGIDKENIIFSVMIMEIRVLQYFLAVAREKSISGAAEALHLSQPTLSRQLKDLENELGTTLFERGTRQISLTYDGMIFRKRAEEICDLVAKAKTDIVGEEDNISGEIHIGAGETHLFRVIAKAISNINEKYPLVKFNIISGDGASVYEQLSKGLIDFGLVFGEIDNQKYDCIELSNADTWGVLARKDSEFGSYKKIAPSDLVGKNVIISRQSFERGDITKWLGKYINEVNFIAKINLIYNASIMVDEGLGYAITLDKLVNNENLKFIPLKPSLYATPNIIWKKYQVMTKASEKFLDELKKQI